ncbi:MAG: aldo/keto reductase [Christensenellales bacterium]
MQTVPFGKLGFEVSRLGFGMMRLPTVEIEGGKRVIDQPEAIRMLRRGIDGGINYVDTAYGYHDGNSEIVTGLALRDGYREKVKLTTKLPQWLVNEYGDMDRLLDEQLKKLGQSYLDVYLLHALNRDAFHKLQALDYKRFVKQAIKDGRIRHIGFSFHDDAQAFLEIVDDYDWDVAQIQFNYMDDENQATEQGLHHAGQRGVSIIVMEPLRGGSLAKPPQEILDMMAANERAWSPVEWAFRYVGNFPEVVTILSGMTTMQQVEDNLAVFDRIKVGSLHDKDQAFIKQVKAAYLARIGVGCTGCNYCQPCPQGVQIPRIFSAYNESYMLNDFGHFKFNYRQIIKDNGEGERCVACGQCEAACPQQLPIIELLKTVAREA